MTTSPRESGEDRSGNGSLTEQLRGLILAGEFAPGQRLVEAEVCERFGVSRSTARAALIDLTHDGLVERVANRGARVRLVSVDEAIAISEVRMAIEGLCAFKAAERVSDQQILELREIGNAMQEAVRTGDFAGYSGLNTRLHDLVRAISEQSVAQEMLARLLARNVRHQFRLALRPGRPNQSLSEHLAIIDEICARSPEGAERAMRRHVGSVIAALRHS